MFRFYGSIVGPSWRRRRGLTWITSDNPVVRLNFNSLQDYNFNGGGGSPGTEIFLPLDPEHLLFTHIGAPRARQRGERMTQAETELIRRFTAEHAWRLILTPDPDDEVQGLRPRTVDRAIFEDERKQWAKWHHSKLKLNENSKSERNNIVCWSFSLWSFDDAESSFVRVERDTSIYIDFFSPCTHC